MFPNLSHSDADRHFQRNLHDHDTTDTGNVLMFTMRNEYDRNPDNVETSSAKSACIATASTVTIAIAAPSDGNGIGGQSYNTNNMANDTSMTLPAIGRIQTIPLPPLSPNIPIQIHTLITYRPSIVLMYWNMSLPPSTARLATNIGFGGRWFRDAAAVPVMSSITVRIRGVSRPVVIFPVEAGRPIRIIDILRAVYNATRAEVLEHGTGDSIAADAIQRHFNNRLWWWGLSPSISEVDVWVLHMRGLSRGEFRR